MTDELHEARIETVQNLITEPALLEQMAEECCELAQALLKKARKLRNENYTPNSLADINLDITEEYTDVLLCAEVLNLNISGALFDQKLNRWIIRNIDKKEF